MKFPALEYRYLPGLMLVIMVFLPSPMAAQTPEIKPQPLYDQCAALAAGGAEDDATARAIASLKDQNAVKRAESARQLGKSCEKRAVDPLIDLLKDADIDVRIAAIESLGRLGDNDSVQFLIDQTFSREWRVRMALISTLASFKIFQAKNMVVNGIANPNGEDISDIDDMRVRCSAILTMNQLKDVSHSRKSLLFLNTFLRSQHAPIREMAEKTMFALKDTRNGPIELIALVKQSNDPHLRKWVIEWIGKLKIEKAVDVLENSAVSDSDPKVQQAAKDALAAIRSGK